MKKAGEFEFGFEIEVEFELNNKPLAFRLQVILYEIRYIISSIKLKREN